MQTCEVEPFRYQSAPVPDPDQGSSGNQINEQRLEGYVARLLEAMCADLTSLQDQINALEARITALEAP
jgi:hypothetical protein